MTLCLLHPCLTQEDSCGFLDRHLFREQLGPQIKPQQSFQSPRPQRSGPGLGLRKSQLLVDRFWRQHTQDSDGNEALPLFLHPSDLCSPPPLIHSSERVRHIALGKVQGPPYYIYAEQGIHSKRMGSQKASTSSSDKT